MTHPKLKSKNECPNCGNQYWYAYRHYRQYMYLGLYPPFMLKRTVLIVDNLDYRNQEAMDVCSECGIAITVYNY